MSTQHGTNHLQTKKKEIDNVLAEYLPSLTKKQQFALQQIATSEKLPKTKVAWCKFLNISRNAYYDWLCQRDWRNAFIEVNRAVNALNIPSVIDNVHHRTKRSDVASRLFMEYIGVIDNEQKPSIPINTVNIAFIAANRGIIKAIADQLADGISAPVEVNQDIIEGQITGD